MKDGVEIIVRQEEAASQDPGAPIELDPKAKLNLIVWADSQISTVSRLRTDRVRAAVSDILRAKSKFDALLLLGDITEYGKRSEYQVLHNLLEPMSDSVRNILAVPGNHDIRLRNFDRQQAKFADFLRSLKNGIAPDGGKYYYSHTIKGYKFIMLGADRAAFEGSYISDEQLRWLDRELQSERGKNQPVFVLNHQPIKNTNGLPVTFLGGGSWRGSVGNESGKLSAVLRKYPNVVFLTGHLHYCTSAYTYEYCGFHAISVPTIGVVNHGDYSKFTQGYIFSVYEDKLIARARVFGEGKYVDEEIPNATIEIQF